MILNAKTNTRKQIAWNQQKMAYYALPCSRKLTLLATLKIASFQVDKSTFAPLASSFHLAARVGFWKRIAISENSPEPRSGVQAP